jgi:hypothetical protein
MQRRVEVGELVGFDRRELPGSDEQLFELVVVLVVGFGNGRGTVAHVGR